jgi:formylglycine-generating enzyme required for sulfatase activity
MKQLYSLSLALVLCLLTPLAWANFINVQNTTLTGQNTTTGTIQVQFDLSWNNSWRDSINYDGAWVFVKYRIGTGTWLHANLNNTGAVTGTGTSHRIDISPLTHANNRPGAMIYRNAGGTGTFNSTGIQLQWNYSSQTVTNVQALAAQLRVFAIEMVFIPQGNYFLGDGFTGRGHFFDGSSLPIQVTGTALAPMFINHPAVGTLNLATRVHGQQGLDLNNDGVIGTWSTDNPEFPTGWRAFWVMKYEISQGQYVDFLNTLPYDHQTQRVNSTTNTVGQNAFNATTTDIARYTIKIGTAGTVNTVPRVYITVRPDRACNHLNWQDGCAYADWSGLRMMSELEYEKAGRGFLNPVQQEFAWGTTTSVQGNTLSGTENGTETMTEANSNFSNINSTKTGGDGSVGPVRVGIHATATSTRVQAGSSYFGVMDLTGNVFEMCVNAQHTPGRSYRGYDALYHGDGELSTVTNLGFANTPFWTGNAGSSVITAASGNVINSEGMVFRGTIGQTWTSWQDANNLSDRQSAGSSTLTSYSNYTNGSTRNQNYGFRCARSAW